LRRCIGVHVLRTGTGAISWRWPHPPARARVSAARGPHIRCACASTPRRCLRRATVHACTTRRFAGGNAGFWACVFNLANAAMGAGVLGCECAGPPNTFAAALGPRTPATRRARPLPAAAVPCPHTLRRAGPEVQEEADICGAPFQSFSNHPMLAPPPLPSHRRVAHPPGAQPQSPTRSSRPALAWAPRSP